jgi:hypothetical protein
MEAAGHRRFFRFGSRENCRRLAPRLILKGGLREKQTMRHYEREVELANTRAKMALSEPFSDAEQLRRLTTREFELIVQRKLSKL